MGKLSTKGKGTGKYIAQSKGWVSHAAHGKVTVSSKSGAFKDKDTAITRSGSKGEKSTKQSDRGKALLGNATEPEYKVGNARAIVVIKRGITQKQLLQLKEKTGLDYEKLSHIMGVTRQTLTRKSPSDTYKVAESDKIYRIAELYSYGYDVFEHKEGFNEWMRTENAALDNKKPVDLLDTMYGFQEVKDLVGRIDYGVFS